MEGVMLQAAEKKPADPNAFLDLELPIRKVRRLAEAIRVLGFYGLEIETGLLTHQVETLVELAEQIQDEIGTIESRFDDVYTHSHSKAVAS
jgi:hypothetical protein